MAEKRTVFQEKLEQGKEYYEIRLESIGGLGANLCGKMLGELGIRYLDVNSSNFSSYGSEKTGTPVKGFIRYCNKDKEIRLHAPITEPDLLVVFHQALLKDSTVLKGCHEGTRILIALEEGQDVVALIERLKKEKKELPDQMQWFGVEAQRIAMETGSRINVVMLGAILKLLGIESVQPGEQMVKDTLGKKYPSSLENNLQGMKKGYEAVQEPEADIQKLRTAKELKQDSHGTEEEKVVLGYLNAPIGGVNPNIGNTVISDLSPSRQGYIPLFIKERCINCGLCFSACPDMVFQFAKGKYKGKDMMINQGLDYYHCKGCLRCVDVCPVNALVMGEEAKQEKKEHFLPNQELLRRPKYYEKAGADGYITSESFLTEKRMEGGEV